MASPVFLLGVGLEAWLRGESKAGRIRRSRFAGLPASTSSVRAAAKLDLSAYALRDSYMLLPTSPALPSVARGAVWTTGFRLSPQPGLKNTGIRPQHPAATDQKKRPEGRLNRTILTWPARRGGPLRCTADADDRSCNQDQRSSRSTGQSSQPCEPERRSP